MKRHMEHLVKIIDKIFLIKYVNQIIEQRNRYIKEYAESEKWKYLS